MAGLGKDHRITESNLRRDFETARANGHEVMIHYAETDLDLGSSMEWMMDCYATIEKTRAFSPGKTGGNEYKDVVRHIAQNNTQEIIAIYDLSAPFEDAVKGTNIAQHPTIQRLIPEAHDMAERARLAARPWWQRIFG